MKKSSSLGPYLLSLPERTVRSLAAVSAGLLREASAIIVPLHFRRSRVYHSIVEQTLRLLIEKVGSVEGVYGEELPLPEDLLVRRGAGNGLDWFSLAVLHVSPVWLLAALADLSGAGGKVLTEIALTLEKEGLLSGGASIRTVAQLLEALERGSGHLAETVNTPPLNVAALRAEWEQLKAAIKIPPDPAAVESDWRQLSGLAAKLERSPLELSAVLALSALRSTQGLVADPLLAHYRKTLTEIEEVGFAAYVCREMQPYLQAAATSFSRARSSSTEALIIKTKKLIA